MKHELCAAALKRRLTTRVMGRNLEVHRVLDSTQTRALHLARQSAPEGTLVLAEEQTQGRGRLGRRWHAPPGSSLLMSLVLRPELAPRQALRTSMIVSLAAIEAVARVCGVVALVKWPNDILVEGRKLGGLLSVVSARGERLEYVVVGLGLNVNLDAERLPPLMSPATSLRAETGKYVSRTELLLALLKGIEARYDRMAAGWQPHEEWRRHLATLGQPVRVGTRREEVIEGVAESVDQDGALWVRTEGGDLRRVLAGDVTLRGHPLG